MSIFNKYIPTISCSDYCSYLIDDNRNVYTFGSNSKGKLGHNIELSPIFPPKQVPNLKNIKILCSGFNFACCCDFDGNVFTFGNNLYGQLGIGNQEKEISSPQLVKIPPVNIISCGRDFVACLTYDGNVYTFGNNTYGQLASNSRNKSLIPFQISCLSDISYIECGGYHVICEDINNVFYSWGKGENGQLSTSSYDDQLIPTIITSLPNNIISLKCGVEHNLFLCVDGEVYSCGNNNYGQLGIHDFTTLNEPKLIPNIPQIERIECGCSHSMCIDINNNLWVFGWNTYGQLGLGNTSNKFQPTLHPIQSICDISSSGYHTMIKTNDNKIFAMGDNSNSQLGIDKSKKNSTQPNPIRVFINDEDMWGLSRISSRKKSARK